MLTVKVQWESGKYTLKKLSKQSRYKTLYTIDADSTINWYNLKKSTLPQLNGELGFF